MAKMRVLSCRDAGLDCDTRLTGESDEEIMSQAAEHLRTAHGMELTAEQAAQAQALIHDEDMSESGTAQPMS